MNYTITEQEGILFRDEVIKNTLTGLGMCLRCVPFRYSYSQIVARYRIMERKPVVELINNYPALHDRLTKKYGCTGCVELKLADIICISILLRRLNVYDAMRSR